MAANPSSREFKSRTLKPQPQPSSDDPEHRETEALVSAVADPVMEPSTVDVVPAETHAVPSHEEVARAAYFMAEARGFEPGHELDDWLTAEAKVRSV